MLELNINKAKNDKSLTCCDKADFIQLTFKSKVTQFVLGQLLFFSSPYAFRRKNNLHFNRTTFRLPRCLSTTHREGSQAAIINFHLSITFRLARLSCEKDETEKFSGKLLFTRAEAFPLSARTMWRYFLPLSMFADERWINWHFVNSETCFCSACAETTF